jgi:hypothetical protein
MKVSVQIIIDHENDQPTITKNVVEFKRESLTTDTLGLTLLESKLLLKNIQSEVAGQQAEHYIHEHKTCAQCHKEQTIKGHHTIVYRTLFGKLTLKSPRLKICSCQNSDQKSISPLSKVLPERMSPEFSNSLFQYNRLI